MKNYKYIYESYIDDRLDNEEALELLLELSDNRSSDFWQFLKLRKHWNMNDDIKRELDSRLKEYFNK